MKIKPHNVTRVDHNMGNNSAMPEMDIECGGMEIVLNSGHKYTLTETVNGQLHVEQIEYSYQYDPEPVLRHTQLKSGYRYFSDEDADVSGLKEPRVETKAMPIHSVVPLSYIPSDAKNNDPCPMVGYAGSWVYVFTETQAYAKRIA